MSTFALAQDDNGNAPDMTGGYNPRECARIRAHQIATMVATSSSQTPAQARTTFQSAAHMAFQLVQHLEAAALEIERAQHAELRAARGEGK